MSVQSTLISKIAEGLSASGDSQEPTELLLTRGEVAHLLGVSHVNVRQWELKRLLPKAGETAEGYSLFSWRTLRAALREAARNGFVAPLAAIKTPGPARGCAMKREPAQLPVLAITDE